MKMQPQPIQQHIPISLLQLYWEVPSLRLSLRGKMEVSDTLLRGSGMWLSSGSPNTCLWFQRVCASCIRLFSQQRTCGMVPSFLRSLRERHQPSIQKVWCMNLHITALTLIFLTWPLRHLNV